MKDRVRKLKSFRHKKIKIFYYLSNGLRYIVPRGFFRLLSKFFLNKRVRNNAYINERVSYYNKLGNSYTLLNGVVLKDFKLGEKDSTYFFDLYQDIKYFPVSNKISYQFGDVTTIPDQPKVVKSRPIKGSNKNSVLLKLNKVRHFNFLNDFNSYKKKKDQLVWRGHIDERTPKRIDFFNAHLDSPFCDIAATLHSRCNTNWKKPKLTIEEQLKYKFILSIEGIDVATNLKWVMSSNSIAVMPEPEFETWFMEGKLIPDYHYICIKKDFTDLEEKLNYFITNPDKAQAIIKHAHDYIRQFKNKKRERAISLLVLEKYFELQQ